MAKALLLLLIYELIGYTFFILFKRYKLYKVNLLAKKLNKNLLIIDELFNLSSLKNYNNDSHVVIFDCVFENMNFELDQELRNEVDRIAGDNVRHIYKPFFLLSSYMKSSRIFFSAKSNDEKYVEMTNIFMRLIMVMVFFMISYIIIKYTDMNKYLDEAILYISNKTENKYFDSESIFGTLSENNRKILSKRFN